MKSTNPYSIHPKHLQNAKALRRAEIKDAAGTPTPPPTAATIRTAGREYVNPVDYQHPFDSTNLLAGEDGGKSVMICAFLSPYPPRTSHCLPALV